MRRATVSQAGLAAAVRIPFRCSTLLQTVRQAMQQTVRQAMRQGPPAEKRQGRPAKQRTAFFARHRPFQQCLNKLAWKQRNLPANEITKPQDRIALRVGATLFRALGAVPIKTRDGCQVYVESEIWFTETALKRSRSGSRRWRAPLLDDLFRRNGPRHRAGKGRRAFPGDRPTGPAGRQWPYR